MPIFPYVLICSMLELHRTFFFFPGFYDLETLKRKYFLITKFYRTSVRVMLSEGLQAVTAICVLISVWKKMTHGWQVHFGCAYVPTLPAEIGDVS